MPTAFMFKLQTGGAAELESISSFVVTPGGSSERIFLFYAAVRSGDRVYSGGGVEEEGENNEQDNDDEIDLFPGGLELPPLRKLF